ARRVELAVDLLHEEVDPLADGPPLAERARQRGEVALEPDDLLGDVAALGEHRDLVRDPVRVELLAADEPHEPLLDLATEGGDRPPVSRSVCTSSRTAPTYARASPGCIATRYRRSAAIGARSTVTSTRPRCAVFRTRSRISVSHAAYSRGTATLTSRKRWLRP